jgi:hypothetical protein
VGPSTTLVQAAGSPSDPASRLAHPQSVWAVANSTFIRDAYRTRLQPTRNLFHHRRGQGVHRSRDRRSGQELRLRLEQPHSCETRLVTPPGP